MDLFIWVPCASKEMTEKLKIKWSYPSALFHKRFLTPNAYVLGHGCIFGFGCERTVFRPGSRGSFGLVQDRPVDSAKGHKAISTQVSTLDRSDAFRKGADRRAWLNQGPPLALNLRSGRSYTGRLQMIT